VEPSAQYVFATLDWFKYLEIIYISKFCLLYFTNSVYQYGWLRSCGFSKPDSHLLELRCVSGVRMRNKNCFKNAKSRKKGKRLFVYLVPHVHIKTIQHKSAARETQWRKISKSFDILVSLRLPYWNLASLISSMFTQYTIIAQRNVAQRKCESNLMWTACGVLCSSLSSCSTYAYTTDARSKCEPGLSVPFQQN